MKFCYKGSVHLSAFCVWVLCYLSGLETEKGEILANMQCVRNRIPASALMSSKYLCLLMTLCCSLVTQGGGECVYRLLHCTEAGVCGHERDRENQNNHKEDRLGELILGR